MSESFHTLGEIINGSTHFHGDKIEFDVSSEGRSWTPSIFVLLVIC